MLLQIGRHVGVDDAVGLLRECHERIRKFLRFAAQLANHPDAPLAEARDLASQIERYFAVSFPLHRADEELEIVPRLRGAQRDVDAALATMEREHGEHEPHVARLVALCAEIAREPARLATVAPELAAVVATVAPALEAHLAAEERVIFPELARLPAGDRDAIRAAMRARREDAR